jgi:predicted acylesterase/phospholipase RssA
MDAFETIILSLFREEGIDLESAILADAPQPLHIVASNLTRCTPTIFEGSVRTLDAIKASCAIPGFFHPQILYDSLYVDGGLYVPSIIDILPLELRDTALVLNLSRPKRGIKPSDLETLAPWSYLYRMYQTSVEYRLRVSLTPNSVWLQNEHVNSMDHLTDEEKTHLIDSGARQFSAFWSKLDDQPLA